MFYGDNELRFCKYCSINIFTGSGRCLTDRPESILRLLSYHVAQLVSWPRYSHERGTEVQAILSMLVGMCVLGSTLHSRPQVGE